MTTPDKLAEYIGMLVAFKNGRTVTYGQNTDTPKVHKMDAESRERADRTIEHLRQQLEQV